MQGLEDVVKKLLGGHIVIFVREDGTQQTFKVLDDVLSEFKNGEWKERVYLPRWTDLQRGKWVF